jgi:ANTAR domain
MENGSMAEVHPPRRVKSAFEAIEAARVAAELAQQAAERAAKAAGREEMLARLGERSADMHERMAAGHRRSEARQRAAARVQATYAEKLASWALRQEAKRSLRPVFMSSVAASAGWNGAVLTVSNRRGVDLLVAASDTTARHAHELEVALAEGPSWEAMLDRESVACPAGLERRWPRYGPAVAELGVQAAVAVPLDLGSSGLAGALTVTGPAVPCNHGDGSGLGAIADALTRTVLLAPGVLTSSDAALSWPGPLQDEDFQPRLHQAAGVLHARYGWAVDDAIALIRAHAYADGHTVADVAAKVVRDGLLAE